MACKHMPMAAGTGARRHVSGFTLIELLVAITILAIIAVMGWRGLDSIIRTRSSLTQEMEQTRGMQIAFAQLESDCSHAADNAWFPQHEMLRVTESALVMIRTVYDDEQPVRLQVVSYRVIDGVFTRRESPATRVLTDLDEYWQSVLTGTDAFTPVSLIADVGVLQISSYPKQVGDTGGNPIQPKGIEVSLQLRDQTRPMIKTFLLGVI